MVRTRKVTLWVDSLIVVLVNLIKNNDAIYAIRSKSKLNSRFAIELRYGKAKGCKSIGNLVAITLVLLQIELYMRDT